MYQVNISEAKAQLSELIQKAVMGEDIVLCNRNVPVARITAIPKNRPPRILGQKVLGEVYISDDFNAPLSEEEMADWERPIE